MMITVIETRAFIARAERLLSEDSRSSIIDFISANPEAGEIMEGTGGVRKLSVALPGRGKRGGARVVYYYHNQGYPVFLLGLFAKNQKDNLTKAERNKLKDAMKTMISAY